jgi:hypothetical protein
MKKDQIQTRLESAAGGADIAQLRLNTAIEVGETIAFVGVSLADLVDSSERASKLDKDVLAISIMMGMLAELATVSARLLSGREHYAGDALLRQIVEIEYLTWCFNEGKREPASWLDSTPKMRKQDYSPRELRDVSAGMFLAVDYGNHCERGGHPTPIGQHLLAGKSPEGAQILLVDLITHLWRSWDNISHWCSKIKDLEDLTRAMNSRIYPPLKQWAENDQIYALMCEVRPAKEMPPTSAGP